MFNFAENRNEDAIVCLERAIAICKHNGENFFSCGMYSRAVMNLAFAHMRVKKPDRALTLLEDLYEEKCMKTGPSEASLQDVVMLLADIYKNQGDHEKADHFMSVAHENIVNSDDYWKKDDALIRILLFRSESLYEKATEDEVLLIEEEEKEALLLEAEKFVKEAYSLEKRGGTMYSRTDLLQHLARVVLARGSLDDSDIDSALSELIHALRSDNIPSRGRVGSERLALATALSLAAQLTVRRVDEAERRAAGTVSCGPGILREDHPGLLKGVEVNIEHFDDLTAAFRYLLEAIEIRASVAARARCSVDNIRQSSDYKTQSSFYLKALIETANKLVNVRMYTHSSETSAKRVSLDWIVYFKVGVKYIKSTSYINENAKEKIGLKEKEERMDESKTNQTGKVGTVEEIKSFSESFLIRWALTFWAVGQVLKRRLRWGRASYAVPLESSLLCPSSGDASKTSSNLKASGSEGINSHVGGESSQEVVQNDTTLIRDDTCPKSPAEEEITTGEGEEFAVRMRRPSEMTKEVDTLLGLSRDILAPIGSVAGLLADLDRESAAMDTRPLPRII
jgi:tetratricopeptide (TPR) repeat protein